MCKITETEYKCGHSATTSRPCEKAKDSNSTWGCLRSSKAKYCSHPREIKKEHEGLCDKCRERAASKTRQGISASKSREPAPAHNENIRLMKGSATERHDFFLQQGAPSKESRGRSRDESRSEFEGTRSNKRSSMINLPHDKAAIPPQRGSISNYKSKPLPNLPPNASKSSKIGGSFASTSRSTSRDGRPLVPPPRHGPYFSDRDTTAVPAALRPRRPSESQGPSRGNIRESQMFTNPGPAPSIPYPVPQDRGRNADPRPLPLQQQQKGQVSYPPNASRHHTEVPRRRLSKTRHTEAIDDCDGRSRSASKTRERSLSRSRHGSKHDKGEKKHHQKQPSAASSFMNKLKAGLGYDEYDDDGSDSDEWVCADSRALERGETIRPSATTTSRRRMSYQAGDYYMHGKRQV